MTPLTLIQARFMHDPVSRRLGGISSDLARLANLIKSGSKDEALYRNLILELKLFTEWTAGDLATEQQIIILELQRALSSWSERAPSSADVENVRCEATVWSDRLLEMSGLVRP